MRVVWPIPRRVGASRRPLGESRSTSPSVPKIGNPVAMIQARNFHLDAKGGCRWPDLRGDFTHGLPHAAHFRTAVSQEALNAL